MRDDDASAPAAAGSPPPAPPARPPRLGRAGRALLAALVLLGALLRFGGLSHDLHEGRVYHPDVAKQMHAVQRFARGVYHQHFDNPDLDGYPLLHAHLVEYFVRVAEPVRRAVLGLLGVPARPDALLGESAIYWMMLLMNAALSTAVIPVVFRIGRENFGPGVAWGAAALQAVSSTDVTASHLATGDATTAFFAALSLLYALRVLRLGRYRDYALAAATATFAFAAKYYAATAFFTVAAAHLLRAGRPAAWFAREALGRAATAAAVAVGALFLADPALFGHFRAELADIWTSMTKSTLRFPRALAHAGRGERFVYSMRVNLPDFVRAVTPVAAAAALLAPLTRLRRDARVWVLLVGPVLYLLLAVGSRALVNPSYHTAVAPALFLLAAHLLAQPWRPGFPAAAAGRALAAGAFGVALALLARDAARETWFSWHQDTRRLAAAWAAENVPGSFRARTSRYAFDWHGEAVPGARAPGTLYADAALASLRRVPDDAVPLQRFSLEEAPLTQFRNVEQRLLVAAPGLLRAGFSAPPPQRAPSLTGNRFVVDDGAELLRSGKVALLDRGQRLARTVVAARPLAEAWIAVQSTALPATVRVSFGGREETVRLTDAAAAFVRIADPRPSWPTGGGRYFYRLAARSSSVRTRVQLATRPGEAGRVLLSLGRPGEAHRLLARAALESGAAAEAALALVAARAAGVAPGEAGRLAALARVLPEVVDDETFFAAYGIHPAYLDALPFVSAGAAELGARGFRPDPPTPAAGPGEPARELVAEVVRPGKRRRELRYAVWTGDLVLDPGVYRGALLLRSLSGGERAAELSVLVSDERGRPLQTIPLAGSYDGRAHTRLPFAFEVPAGVTACSFRFTFAAPPDAAVGGVEIRPDPVANARALGAALREALAAAGPAPAPPRP